MNPPTKQEIADELERVRTRSIGLTTAVLDDVLSATDGRSVVMVSHRPEALDRFDTVLDLGARHPAAPPPKE